MLIASIDLETTGTNPETCQILDFAAVFWDTTDFVTPVAQLPTFHCYVVHDQLRGQPHALAMNVQALQRIADREPGFDYVRPHEVGRELREFIKSRLPEMVDGGRIVLSPSAFNFDSFDRQFLARLKGFGEHVELSHRSLCPASLFFDPMIDVKIPSSDEVFRRAGVRVDNRHTALGDARATVDVLRAGYRRGGDGGVAVPATPRCPRCQDRKTVKVHTGFDGWDEEPCPTCCLVPVN